MNDSISPMQWFQIGLLVLVGAAGILFLNTKNNGFIDSSASEDGSTASLLINFGNGTARMFRGEVYERTTILDAVYSSTHNGNIEFRYAVDQSGMVNLHTINAEPNHTHMKEWHFYINDTRIPSGVIGKTILKPGDRIVARFE